MPSSAIRDIVVAETDEAFDRCFRRGQKTFPDEDGAFEALYGPLDELIQRKLEEAGLRWETDFFTLGSWWSNRTRYFECDQRVINSNTVRLIQGLLVDGRQEWAVQFVAYADYANPAVDSAQVGSMVVYPDWVLVDASLRSRLEFE